MQIRLMHFALSLSGWGSGSLLPGRCQARMVNKFDRLLNFTSREPINHAATARPAAGLDLGIRRAGSRMAVFFKQQKLAELLSHVFLPL